MRSMSGCIPHRGLNLYGPTAAAGYGISCALRSSVRASGMSKAMGVIRIPALGEAFEGAAQLVDGHLIRS